MTVQIEKIDINFVRNTLIEHGLYIKENISNFICKCVFCGDHRQTNKQGHLWVSKDLSKPFFNCFLCQTSGSIPKLIYYLIGKVYQIDTIEYKPRTVFKPESDELIIPPANINRYPYKFEYFNKRTCGLSLEYVPVVFSIKDLLSANSWIYNRFKEIFGTKTDYIINLLETKFIGFISKHRTLLWFRNVDERDTKFKFFKFKIGFIDRLDYICIESYSNFVPGYVVLSEGPFNIMKEFKTNTLNIDTNNVLYAAGLSFSYNSLIRSILYDYFPMMSRLIIISDHDKKVKDYVNIFSWINLFFSSIHLYYNLSGKDFGSPEVYPYEFFKQQYVFNE